MSAKISLSDKDFKQEVVENELQTPTVNSESTTPRRRRSKRNPIESVINYATENSSLRLGNESEDSKGIVGIIKRFSRILNPFYAILTIVLIFAFSILWYRNVAAYVPDTKGSFEGVRWGLLVIKKFLSVVIVITSSAASSLILMFLCFPKWYEYTNYSHSGEFDFYSDLLNLNDNAAWRRVLVYLFIFVSFFITCLYLYKLSLPEILL